MADLRHPAIVAFAVVAALPAGAATPPVRLECETVNTQSTSYQYHQPILHWTFQSVRLTIDRDARTVLFETRDEEGKPLVVLRTIAAISGDTVMICQADVCQQAVPDGVWSSTTGLTVVNLRERTLNRKIESTWSAGGGGNIQTIVREGRCRPL